MPISHILLALLVVVIWGINFLFVKLGLNEISPLLLLAVRFILASIPAIFFIKPPAVPFRMVALYGLVMFALQFGLLFFGMSLGMPAGMTSIIMQVQVFFSMFFAAIWLKDIPDIWQVLGALVAFSGIALVGMHFDGDITLLGFVCILAGAATWGIGNLITKKIKNVNMISLVIWGSLVAAVPTTIAALILEGPQSIVTSYHQLSWVGIVSLLYIVYASTWVGYGVWNWLIGHHPVGLVVPFTLLVPIVAVLSSVIVTHEEFQSWQIIAGLLVMGGLAINLLGAKLFLPILRKKISQES